MSHTKWATFVQRCLLQRVDGEDFGDMTQLMLQKHPVKVKTVLEIIFKLRDRLCSPGDPLVPQYIATLIDLGVSQISDVLFLLAQSWSEPEYRKAKDPKRMTPAIADARVVLDLTNTVASNEHQEIPDETRKGIVLSSRFLTALVKLGSEPDSNFSQSQPLLKLIENIALFLVSASCSNNGMDLLADKTQTEPRRSLATALHASQPTLATISSELTGRLDLIQKHFGLDNDSPLQGTAKEGNLEEENETHALQLEASTVDIPVVHTKAGLLLYIDATLCGRPVVGDHKLVSFLAACYADDYNSMLTDTVSAAFSALIAAEQRHLQLQSLRLYQIFLVEKMPVLLALIATTSLEPISPESCISQALQQVETILALLTSTSSAQVVTHVTTVRQQFLAACSLHKVLPLNSIPNMPGLSSAIPNLVHGLYKKDELAQQIRANPARIVPLLKELTAMTGNAGAICQAIMEVMHRHCQTKETLPLKELCSSLVQRPDTFEVLALFSSPARLLAPLCALLDNWSWDDLHGESQPVYEEFGGILLFVLAYQKRFSLDASDIGAVASNSFTRRLLDSDASDKALDQLDNIEMKNLGDWISALFTQEHLSDELTSSCSPQQFYLLVPTLFSQSLCACGAAKLSMDTLKSGLEYLLEPFLLPSVLIAITWLMHDMWSVKDDANLRSSLQLLQLLIKPPTSSEAKSLHQTITAIAAEALNRSLNNLNDKPAVTGEVTQLLAALQSRPAYSHLTTPTHSELEPHPPVGGQSRTLLSTLTHLIHTSIQWSTNPSPTPPPPHSIPRATTAAISLHGCAPVLQTLLSILNSTPHHHHDAALDIISHLICCPSNPRASEPLTLHSALHLAHSDLPSYLPHPTLATALIRLHRRVELLSVLAPTAPDSPTNDNTALQMNIDAVDANASFSASAAAVATHLPTDIDDMLNSAAAAAATSTLDTNFDASNVNVEESMDDIFAGLDETGDMMGMGSFDDIDMEGMF